MPPQPQLLQQKERRERKETNKGGLLEIFERVVGGFLPGLSRSRRHSENTKGREEEVCCWEGRSGQIIGEVLASTRDMLNLWVAHHSDKVDKVDKVDDVDKVNKSDKVDKVDDVDWCAAVRQAAGRGAWAR